MVSLDQPPGVLGVKYGLISSASRRILGGAGGMVVVVQRYHEKISATAGPGAGYKFWDKLLQMRVSGRSWKKYTLRLLDQLTSPNASK